MILKLIPLVSFRIDRAGLFIYAMVAVKGGIMKRLSKSVILIAIAFILLTFAFTACDTTSRELHTVTFLADGVTVKSVLRRVYKA